MRVEWQEFKSVVDETNLDILMTQNDSIYFLSAGTDDFAVRCHLLKDDSTDTEDFETNYLALCNPYRQKYDQTGKPFARFAIANEGHIMSCLSINFTTSKSGSLRCKTDDNSTNVSGISYYQYDNQSNSGTDQNTVMTEVIVELPFDYEMVGARIYQSQAPTCNMYGYMTAAPDIPAQYGGSRDMCSGGLNFKMIDKNYGIDGRAPKMFFYDAVNHTNKLRLRLYHDAGYQHDFMFIMEMYK
jgi:hypothetical protein